LHRLAPRKTGTIFDPVSLPVTLRFCPVHPFSSGVFVNGRSKWLKRGLSLLAFAVVIGAGFSVMSYVLIRRTPDWYQPDSRTPDQRSRAADKIENLLILLRNWGGEQHAAKLRSNQKIGSGSADSHPQEQAKELLAHKPDQAFTISFTDDELNAFFNKWAEPPGRRAWFDQYVIDPRLVIRGNQLIIVGKPKTVDLIVSLVFEPKLDGDGNLNLNLVHVLGGVLPLPDAMWANQRTVAEETLQFALPRYQQAAAITPEGIANGDAASAAMNELLLATMQYKPASAVIFVPIELQHLSQSLPVKITALSLHDHTLEMTVEGMSAQERESLLQRLEHADDSQQAEYPPH
jgi:hypothetical protein